MDILGAILVLAVFCFLILATIWPVRNSPPDKNVEETKPEKKEKPI